MIANEQLCTKGFSSPEQPLKVRTRISTNEKGKRYVLVTTGIEESVVYAVDGNIITSGLRCDKLILVKRSASGVEPEQWTESFIELKGVDTVHAINQLRETLKKSIFKHPSNDVVRPVSWHSLFLRISLILQWKKRNKSFAKFVIVTSGA